MKMPKFLWTRPLCGMAWTPRYEYAFPGEYGCWFRILGYGLHISTRKKEDAYFSERYGYREALYVLGLRIELLTFN